MCRRTQSARRRHRCGVIWRSDRLWSDRLWTACVDDTFCILKRSSTEELFHHLHKVDQTGYQRAMQLCVFITVAFWHSSGSCVMCDDNPSGPVMAKCQFFLLSRVSKKWKYISSCSIVNLIATRKTASLQIVFPYSGCGLCTCQCVCT